MVTGLFLNTRYNRVWYIAQMSHMTPAHTGASLLPVSHPHHTHTGSKKGFLSLSNWLSITQDKFPVKHFSYITSWLMPTRIRSSNWVQIFWQSPLFWLWYSILIGPCSVDLVSHWSRLYFGFVQVYIKAVLCVQSRVQYPHLGKSANIPVQNSLITNVDSKIFDNFLVTEWLRWPKCLCQD